MMQGVIDNFGVDIQLLKRFVQRAIGGGEELITFASPRIKKHEAGTSRDEINYEHATVLENIRQVKRTLARLRLIDGLVQDGRMTDGRRVIEVVQAISQPIGLVGGDDFRDMLGVASGRPPASSPASSATTPHRPDDRGAGLRSRPGFGSGPRRAAKAGRRLKFTGRRASADFTGS